MTLLQAQWEFLKDVGKMITFIEQHNHSASGGELQRTLYQQQQYLKTGKTRTLNSLHIHKLAIDLAIFAPDGKWLQDKKSLQVFGDYWEFLDPENEWGGNWNFLDTPHFQRRLPE
jgi:hypothetical protein